MIALQEVSAESFDADWTFLREAGYECALFGKGRLRPATFWRATRLALCTADGKLARDSESGTAGVISGDRTLTTMLRVIGEDGVPIPTSPLVFVVNCHLSAGDEARRRLRQVHEALDSIRKVCAKSAGANDDLPTAIVVCGDFNAQGTTGVRQLLTQCSVDKSFRENEDPTRLRASEQEVTSKAKKQPFGPFVDAAEHAYGCEPFPTVVVAELMSRMLAEGGEGPSEALTSALDEMFEQV